MRYGIRPDGGFDVLGGGVRLLGCYPAIDGTPIRPLCVSVGPDSITYSLARGELRVGLSETGGRLRLTCEAKGLCGVHDIEPLGHARVEGADRLFVQGLGMEGPSGLFPLEENAPLSHGLAALTGGETSLIAYAEDHRRFGVVFRAESERRLSGQRTVFSGGFDLEGTAGDELTLPALFFAEANALADGLRECAARIAETMDARQRKPPAYYWCSWYYAYQTLDQALLEEYLSGMKNTPGADFQYIELDAGYAPSLGDWLLPSPRYPGGLGKAAETILAAGYQPGIWIGPFMVGDQSELYRRHPDWILRGRDGEPVTQLRSYTEPKLWGNRDGNYYILDASHPEALRYLEEVFRTLRGWGFTFFKTDFMLWNMQDSSAVRRYDPGLTSVEILRNTLAVIRRAIGEESYLLGCIAPFMPFIGYADGMRLAGDVGARWAEPYGPINMLRELPCDNYFQHIFWQNDPDSVLLRDFDTFLTPEETRSLALLQALSGGVISTSDPVHLVGEDRKALLRLIRPGEKAIPCLPAWEKHREELILTHRLDQGNLLYILNPTDRPLTVCADLAELFGGKNWYQYRYLWEEEACVSVMDDRFVTTLQPHESALVFVTARPLREKPSNLWDWK